ncbi:MAG: hypothetical protein KF836_03000 [Fimbriimonadaceae bacterium]|nr:hypothetical protein [Fimbriimonadaceae bacterium]
MNETMTKLVNHSGWEEITSELTAYRDHLKLLGAQAFQAEDPRLVEKLTDQWREVELAILSIKDTRNKIAKLAATAPSDISSTPLTKEERIGIVSQSIEDALNVTDDLFNLENWKAVDTCLCKSTVCDLRGYLLTAIELEIDSAEIVDALRDLKERFEEENPEVPFYGFSMRRQHPPEVWSQLAEAYKLMSVAADALDWAEANNNAEEESFRDLVISISSVETWLYRVFGDYDLKVGDDQQRSFNARVRALSEGQFYVPWWNMDPSAKVETWQIAEAARRLPAILEATKELQASGPKEKDSESAKEETEAVAEESSLN